MSPQYDRRVESWLLRHKLDPPATDHPDWGIVINISTVPPFDWTVRRSKIKPNELWFGIGISRLLGWSARLFPRDKSFEVSWGSAGCTVESENLRYRRMMQWPEFDDLDQLPAVAERLESLLKVRFCRQVDLHAATLKAQDLETLRQWLRPICDSYTCYLGDFHGNAPASVGCDDGRSTGEGLTLTVSTASPFEGQ